MAQYYSFTGGTSDLPFMALLRGLLLAQYKGGAVMDIIQN